MFLRDKLYLLFNSVQLILMSLVGLALWCVIGLIGFITRWNYVPFFLGDWLADRINEKSDELCSDLYVLTGIDLRNKD